MARQPSGTVTFLFSDIEGSTRLLEALGNDRYAVALHEHRTLLREAFARLDGFEVDCEGDAFFVAFQAPGAAVAAAGEAQEALAAHVWPGGQVLRVRMGIHTGQPLVAEPKYVGMDVHRAARIMAAAHGGQVLVSAATVALLEPRGSEPPGLALRDLGEHRFKDLAAAERVYQLGEAQFPPIRSLYHSNLPVPATAFLGRDHELMELVELLSAGDARVVTLTGPGGTGKTRLALQAAAEVSDSFPDGVWWVPLAELESADLVPQAFAAAIGFEAGADPLGAATTALAGRRLLALADNAEHLLPDAARSLADLCTAVPSLRLLVTSRERLGVAAEVVKPLDSMRSADCIELFEARARAVGASVAGDPAIAAVCDAVDGLPLAIELVAARTRLFSPAQLLDRLGGAIDLPAGVDAHPRQRTIRATIAWSHDLLAEEESTLFARISVFRGGCDLDSAEEVCGATLETVLALLDKSLVRRDTTRLEPRFWMLETIREFAVERLEERGETAAIRDRHADHFGKLVREAAPHMHASPQRAAWVARLDVEQPNVRAALERMLETGAHERLAEAVVGLGRYWYSSAQHLDGSRWFGAVASAPLPPALRAKVDAGAAIFVYMSGDPEGSRRLAASSVALWKTLPDKTGISDPLASLGAVALVSEDADAAARWFTEALAAARADGDLYWEAANLVNLSEAMLLGGSSDDALAALDDAELAAREASPEIWLLVVSNRGSIHVMRGEFEQALPPVLESALIAVREGYMRIGAFSLAGLARIAVEHGRPGDAALLLGSARPFLAPGEVPLAERRWRIAETRGELERALAPAVLDETLARGSALSRDELLDLLERQASP